MPPNNQNLEYQLSQHLDGQLDAEVRAKLQKRLAEDPELSRQWQRYTELDCQLDALSGEPLPEIDFDEQRERIVAAVERKALLEGYPKRRWVIGTRSMAVAAAAMLLMGVAIGLWSLWPGKVISPQQQVAVAVLSEAPAGLAAGQLEVHMPRLAHGEYVTQRFRPEALARMPVGTVMVSMSGVEEISSDGFAAEMFPIE